jgi:hypothetical protein
MEEMQAAKRRRATLVTVPAMLAGAVLAAAGCGGTSSSGASRPRPAVPIIITASISPEQVSVSPRKFGAGPITLIVSNQTGASQQVTLESDEAPGQGPGIRQQTAPINPRDTASLKADVRPGRYRVAVAGDAIRAATVNVGKERASAENDVLLP